MTTEQVFLQDNYVTITPGKPIKLFPLKPIYKGGVKRDIEAIAKKMKLPHFRPVIKLGSHADDAPAGGHIVGIEVRDGYVWGIPEWTEKGLKAIEDGDYRYNSPEIIWEGGLENPDTGEIQAGPLIVGDALLHMPHLGESAALYSTEVKDGGNPMTMLQENDMVSVSVLERLRDFFRAESPTELDPPVQPQEGEKDEYAAQLAAKAEEVELLQAQMAQLKADAERDKRVDKFAAELGDDDEQLHGILADLDGETAEVLVTKFKALKAQADMANLDKDIGSTGDPNTNDNLVALDAKIKARAEKDGIAYYKAAQLVTEDK